MVEQIRARVSAALPEMVEFLQELIRIPTVNPPGEGYAECARLLRERYKKLGYEVEYIEAEGRPEHTARHPRVNVLARLGDGAPCLHFNGHMDVVPAGEGWTVDPFAGVARDGKVFGRGACDMKAGLVASLYAVEALRRSGARLAGAVEQSATVDEESGGFAGVAYLAECGRLSARRQQHVIITEPHGSERICLGHRGVYWFEVVMHGRMAHGSMPFLGVNAIGRMHAFLSAVNTRLRPKLEQRVTALPVAPPGARRATLNLNSIAGGQPPDQTQTPCVPDRCTAIFDRRFLPEEDFAAVKQEIQELLEEAGQPYEWRDRMIVHPTFTPETAPTAVAVCAAVEQVCGRPPEVIASPGTYDQKHFVRIAHIDDCISYGPGILDLAHQPDEYVRLEDLERATQVMALAALRLVGER